MKKQKIVLNDNVIEVMANGFYDDRTTCPVCGETKDSGKLTDEKCRNSAWLVKKVVMQRKISLPSHFSKA